MVSPCTGEEVPLIPKGTPDPDKRAKLGEGLERGLSVYEAALGAGYSDRHARRLEWWP
jgi:hypothetical protein